jgi:hypothetical protein
MLGFLLVAGLVALGLRVLQLQARRAPGPTPFILAALPLAALFPTLGVASHVWGLAREFHGALGSGAAARPEVVRLCVELTEGLRLSAFGCVLALLAAWGLEIFAKRGSGPAQPTGTAEGDRLSFSTVVLAGAPMLAAPTAFVMSQARGIAPMIQSRVLELTTQGRAADLGTFGETVVSQLVFTGILCLALGLVSLTYAAANIVAVRSALGTERLVVYARAVLIVLVALAMWHVTTLSGDLGALTHG